jgi:hypothetical protein
VPFWDLERPLDLPTLPALVEHIVATCVGPALSS